jgi:hypothetical protein
MDGSTQVPAAGKDSSTQGWLAVQVVLWGGDALELCLGGDLEQHWQERVTKGMRKSEAGVGMSEPGSHTNGGDGSSKDTGNTTNSSTNHPSDPSPDAGTQPLLFDVIDTSNLADYVGLLNLLVATQLRLAHHPGARMTTASMTWAGTLSTMREYCYT